MPAFLVSLLESPTVPLAVLVLITVGLGVAARAREDSRLLVGAVSAAAAAATLALAAWLVPTPGSRAVATIDRLVAAAEQADFDGPEGMFAQLSDSASLHFGTDRSPGVGLEGLKSALRTLGRRHRIRENTVLSRSFRTLAPDRVMVELGCRTVTESSMGGPVVTGWSFELRLDEASDRWVIQRVVFQTLGGRPADSRILR